ncbi:hypothetical protein [Alkalicoccobacillus porphyridii]|uniref:Uncharacterized protein n=1 Tax=Alkalicoccobacillus porphyridii TaxID=2597270 RepID=A0A554A436_9BACI|nr:hypothetical protein [Alkalicoccobacillus porphyridii]TSB48441.1 hypothetical protein FN960_02485 [Alkalicoccobacillus porphyridii]
MISREDALFHASSITKSLAAAKGHTHFIKTIASLLRKYSRNEQAYKNGDEFIQLVLSEFCDYLSSLCVTIDKHRDEIRMKAISEEEKALFLVEANGIHFALQKMLNELKRDSYHDVIIYNETAMSYLPGLPDGWTVSKKGQQLIVSERNEGFEVVNKAN